MNSKEPPRLPSATDEKLTVPASDHARNESTSNAAEPPRLPLEPPRIVPQTAKQQTALASVKTPAGDPSAESSVTTDAADRQLTSLNTTRDATAETSTHSNAHAAARVHTDPPEQPTSQAQQAVQVHQPDSPPVLSQMPSGQTQFASHLASIQKAVPAEHPESTETASRLSGPLGLLWRLPWATLGAAWRFSSVVVLLAVVAAIPIVQFASLGYILYSSARLSQGRRWRECLPGSVVAGRITQFTLCAFLLWLPVWFVTDLAYSAQLVSPGSSSAASWRMGAFVVAGIWVLLVGWAACRGGKIQHFLWPAPIRFLKESWRPAMWSAASDRLFAIVESIRFPKLWLLGVKAAAGALIWTFIPVSLMIVGLRGEAGITGLLGLVGAVCMMVVMLYLPFLQIQMASSGKFIDLFRVKLVRHRFCFSPFAHAFTLMLLCLACLPLYLLRIEATPAALLWAPSLVFVLFMMPVKWLLGAAMGYARTRELAARAASLSEQAPEHLLEKQVVHGPVVAEAAKRSRRGVRHWSLRWPARFIAFASVAVYVGSLYVAQLVAGQGILVMYFQHAFLVPAPLISS